MLYGHMSFCLQCLGSVCLLRWEEKRDGVKWSVDPNSDQHVHIYLPVLESILGIFEIKLVRQMAAIVFETALDFNSLFWSEEFGTTQISNFPGTFSRAQ